MTNLERYNNLVKEPYQIDDEGMERLMLNEVNYNPEDALIPYYEIPKHQTKSGHTVIFEPDLVDFDLDLFNV